jgi:hypothetical protein
VVARGRSCMGAQARSKQGAESRKTDAQARRRPIASPWNPKKTDKNCDTVLLWELLRESLCNLID